MERGFAGPDHSTQKVGQISYWSDVIADTQLKPEVLMQAMRSGMLEGGLPSFREAFEDVEWTSEREGLDRLIVHGVKPGDHDDLRVGLVLERSGFVTWRLTALRMPTVAHGQQQPAAGSRQPPRPGTAELPAPPRARWRYWP